MFNPSPGYATVINQVTPGRGECPGSRVRENPVETRGGEE